MELATIVSQRGRSLDRRRYGGQDIIEQTPLDIGPAIHFRFSRGIVLEGDGVGPFVPKELDHGNARDPFQQETEGIVLAALQVAAEAMAVDPGARGRLSSRQTRLRDAIEHQFLRREMRKKEQRPGTKRPRKSKRTGPDDEIIL